MQAKKKERKKKKGIKAKTIVLVYLKYVSFDFPLKSFKVQ